MLARLMGQWDVAEQKYPGVKTAFHAIDFAKADEAAYEGLAAALKEKDVSVLGE